MRDDNVANLAMVRYRCQAILVDDIVLSQAPRSLRVHSD